MSRLALTTLALALSLTLPALAWTAMGALAQIDAQQSGNIQNTMLWIAAGVAQSIHDRVITLSRCWRRHIPGRSWSRNPAHIKTHPSQSYKRSA